MYLGNEVVFNIFKPYVRVYQTVSYPTVETPLWFSGKATCLVKQGLPCKAGLMFSIPGFSSLSDQTLYRLHMAVAPGGMQHTNPTLAHLHGGDLNTSQTVLKSNNKYEVVCLNKN